MMTYDVLTLPAHKVKPGDQIEFEGVAYYVQKNARSIINGRAARMLEAATSGDHPDFLNYHMPRKATVRILRRVK